MVFAMLMAMLCGHSATRADITHHVVIVTSSDSSYQKSIASRIHQNLEDAGTRTMTIAADDIASTSRNGKTLYVTIGNYATQTLDDFDSASMALRISDRVQPGRKFTSTKADLITAQPECRHILLIRSLNPDWTAAGVLSSVKSADTAAALTRCAIKYDVNLQVYAITDKSDLQKTLEKAVRNNKVLLAIDDPDIFNRHNVKNILLTAYRHRKPVIGYSDSFVQAGAIAAVYTSAESAGDRAADILSEFFRNSWQFSQKIYSTEDLSISVNRQVAASLDLDLPDVESIRSSITGMEEKP
jgi:putative ABC transport system substrate-binding protein